MTWRLFDRLFTNILLHVQMWHADNQQYAVAFVVFSSVGGSILGPVIGGFVQQYLAWQWNIWIQVSFLSV